MTLDELAILFKEEQGKAYREIKKVMKNISIFHMPTISNMDAIQKIIRETETVMDAAEDKYFSQHPEIVNHISRE